MIGAEVIQAVLGRLTDSGAGIATFSADEVAQWPVGSVEALAEAGLLKQAPPAKAIECDGCEENCIMSVNVITAPGAKKARAFIACDKREDVGRVPVELDRLQQWQTTGELLAKAVAPLLGLEQSPKADLDGQRWKLGTFKGHHNRPHLTLNMEDGVNLEIAGHVLPLADVLSFGDRQLAIDSAELAQLADKPAGEPAPRRYQPSITRREERKLHTKRQHQAWQEAYQEWKHKRPGMSDVWYSRQIARMGIANGRDAETIRKNMKL